MSSVALVISVVDITGGSFTLPTVNVKLCQAIPPLPSDTETLTQYVFPAWVFVVSVYILIGHLTRSGQARPEVEADSGRRSTE